MKFSSGTLRDWDGMAGYRPHDSSRAERVAAVEATYPPGILDDTATDADWLAWGERLTANPPPRPNNTQMHAMAKAARWHELNQPVLDWLKSTERWIEEMCYVG